MKICGKCAQIFSFALVINRVVILAEGMHKKLEFGSYFCHRGSSCCRKANYITHKNNRELIILFQGNSQLVEICMNK